MNGHGDLIDREVLLGKINDLWTEYGANGWEYIAKKDVLDVIWDADVVIEESDGMEVENK